MNNTISRRRLLKSISVLPFLAGGATVLGQETPSPSVKGNIRQAVTFSHGNLRALFSENPQGLSKQLLEMGILGLDLVNPEEWESVIKTGLLVTVSRVPDASQQDSFNHVQFHDKMEAVYNDIIPKAAKAGVKQVICFSGHRRELSDDEGIHNCITGLKRVIPTAEKHGVTLIMELLNPFNHKGYHADRTDFGAQIARGLGSENFKLLYDIYHMQRSEGNLIDTINKNVDVIGHYHTAGSPERKDLDENQEIYYPAVMRAIVKTGFKGFVAHEFGPKKRDNLQSLRDAVKICDV